jgi:hypothetical protein
MNDLDSSEVGQLRFGLLLLLESTARKGTHSKTAQRDMTQSEGSVSKERKDGIYSEKVALTFSSCP